MKFLAILAVAGISFAAEDPKPAPPTASELQSQLAAANAKIKWQDDLIKELQRSSGLFGAYCQSQMVLQQLQAQKPPDAVPPAPTPGTK